MSFIVCHVISAVNLDRRAISANFTFQVTGGTVSVLQANTSYMVRPLGELLNDITDTAIVADQIPMLRSGYVMATDAVIGFTQRGCGY
jgi:hypothetical protein